MFWYNRGERKTQLKARQMKIMSIITVAVSNLRITFTKKQFKSLVLTLTSTPIITLPS